MSATKPLGKIVSGAVVVATGVTAERGREVLGLDVAIRRRDVLERVPPLGEDPRPDRGAVVVISDAAPD